MKHLKSFLLFCLTLTLSVPAFAQNRITGQVTDPMNEPVVGANVKVKGTTIGAITDIEGHFTLNVTQGVLVVSYIGYKTYETEISGKTHYTIVLEEDMETLDEVVVVGYGTQKKATLTGAISTVGEKTFQNKGVLTTPIQALQGQVAGMTVTRSSSAPGREDWSYKIRGQASINDPGALVLIDGVPGGIADVNPDDIENISVLKDAAAAVYGSRAAGGVVLVTTKRGKEQKTQISYKGNMMVKTPSMQQKWMSMEQWAASIEEAVLNQTSIYEDGQWRAPNAGQTIGAFKYWVVQAMKTKDPRYWNTVQSYDWPGINDIGFLEYDMNDETWGTSVSHTHSIGINGGNDKNRYNISFGYMNDQSSLRSKWGDDEYTRYNVRVNHDVKITGWFDLATNLSFDRRETVYPNQRPTTTSGNPPGSPLLTPSGNPFGWASNITPVVQSKFGGSKEANINSFKLNIQPEFHLMKGLDLIGNIYFNPWDTNDCDYRNIITWYDYSDVPYNYKNPSSDYVNREAKTVMKQQYQGYLNYKNTFAEDHNLNIMGGASYEKERATKIILERSGLSVPDLHSVNTAGNYNKGQDDIQTWAMASYFGRINYDYKGRYIIEGLGRYDGSSKFIKGKKWSPFFGVSGAWRISEEVWMQSNGVFDNLKIRGSYGEIGNQAGIDNYDYIALVELTSPGGTTATAPLFGPDASPSYGQIIKQKNVVAADRTWEKIKTTNIGLDFAILKNRLSGTFDYFIKKNDNMLSEITYPQVYGATAPKTNSGKMEVKGWEVTLSWRDKIGEVSYFVSGNLSDNKNKLISKENAITKTWDAKTSYLEGYPINTYWGLDADRLIANEAELEAYRAIVGSDLIDGSLLSVGDMMYKDVDGDGKVTRDDVKNLGDNIPHYSFGVNLGAEWKGFDLSMIIQGVGKQTILRNKSAATILIANTYQNQGAIWYGKSWSDIGEKLGGNYAIEYLDKDGNTQQGVLTLPAVNKDPNAVPRSTNNGTVRNYNYAYSNAWYRLQNGAYARMKNITVGYTLPKHWLKAAGVSNLRVYFSGNDLFEITKTEDGWDPEATAEDPFGGTNGSNGYPFTRSYSFGIDLTF